MKMKQMAVGVAVTMGVAGSYAAITTDSFGSGDSAFSINFVDIGGAGNVADEVWENAYDYWSNDRGYGAVSYTYRIGQTEITSAQFAAAYAEDPNIGSSSDQRYAPAVNVTGYEVMKFANYLTTKDAYKGAYLFDDEGNFEGVDRDAAVDAYGIVYVVPTEDEWYKAAYYKPINDGTYSLYANGGSDTNTPPEMGGSSGWNYGTSSFWSPGSGAMEQNGTYDMMGNAWEWNETTDDYSAANRGGSIAGEEYLRSSYTPVASRPLDYKHVVLGFRVAAIPEPASMALIGLFGGGILFIRRIFMM